jgi:hypothetical protein
MPSTKPAHVYDVRPRKDHRGVDLISDVLPFGRLWYDTPDNAVGYAMHYSRSHDAVIRVYDDAGNVIETHGHVSTHPAEANHSNLHIYFAKVVL